MSNRKYKSFYGSKFSKDSILDCCYLTNDLKEDFPEIYEEIKEEFKINYKRLKL